MKYLPTVLLSLLAALLLCLSASRISALRSRGRQRGLLGWLLFEIRREGALRQRFEELRQCHQIKKNAAAGLIDERLTLHDAIEQFEMANELMQDGNDELVGSRRPIPQTERELGRDVLGWTRALSSRDPERAEQVVQQLEQQFPGDPNHQNEREELIAP